MFFNIIFFGNVWWFRGKCVTLHSLLGRRSYPGSWSSGVRRRPEMMRQQPGAEKGWKFFQKNARKILVIQKFVVILQRFSALPKHEAHPRAHWKIYNRLKSSTRAIVRSQAPQPGRPENKFLSQFWKPESDQFFLCGAQACGKEASFYFHLEKKKKK